MIVTLKTGEKYSTISVGTIIGDTIVILFRDDKGEAHFIDVTNIWFIEDNG